ncbi:MAG: DUF1385 domain-containing protein [Oscillospiraceae bacterium]|nr:DUF1385 domain-containing protein [Oscillospiraceae bacterium]
MAKQQEKFKTMIGGQALIEGIMMRGPEKDAVVVRTKEGLQVDVKPRKVYKKGSICRWPLIRGVVTFFDSQVSGVKALMQSADLSPDEQEEPSKLDQWLEKKLGSKAFQNLLVSVAVFMGLAMSVGLFFLLPSLAGDVMEIWVDNPLLRTLLEGVVRILIFVVYIVLMSRMKDMRRVFSYHGAEHKTIRCYEAGLPLTVENIQKQTRLHPRCGTSFLLIVMILSILLFSVATALLEKIPVFTQLEGIYDNLLMMGVKLLLLPLLVAISYEFNRLVGRYDNWLTRILTAPGMWFQKITTAEPDDSMIEVAITAVEAVLPEQEGADRW